MQRVEQHYVRVLPPRSLRLIWVARGQAFLAWVHISGTSRTHILLSIPYLCTWSHSFARASMGQSTSQPAPTDSGSATKRGPLAQKDSKIVIVGGAGTMGSSTALHLARRGFTDIRVLDVYQSPSMDSAGNDLNKVDIFRKYVSWD